MTSLRMGLLGALAVLALAAGWSERFPALDPEAFQARLERWRTLDAAEQRDLSERWNAFQALPEPRQDELRRRKATLDRLRRRQPAAAATEREALEVIMGEFERQARELLAADADVEEGVRAQTQRRVDAFLDNMERSGHLEPAEHRRIAALDFEQRVRESLLVLKREQLDLYAEFLAAATAGSPEPVEVVELRALDPMEVVDELRSVRAEVGFLGPAARLLDLSPGRRQQLAQAVRAGQMERVAEWLRPQVAEALVERGYDSQVIASALELPYAELERRLNRLLAKHPAKPAPAAAPASR